jgi:deoxycytidylate deaminase
MKFLSGEEKKKAIEYMEKAAEIALNSSCIRSKCGSIIVKDGEIIGSGFNSPPAEMENQRRCRENKKDLHEKVTDKTCCVHAEQRAMIDALKRNPEKILGSRLFFIRLDEQGNIKRAGKPYCTICSKMALDIGIAEFVLWHKEGICVYNTDEYNKISFQFTE